MALIKCKECNEAVSDKAHTCPHCGVVVNYAESELRKCLIGLLKRARIISMVLALICILCFNLRMPILWLCYLAVSVVCIFILSMRISKLKEPRDDVW